MGTLLNGIDSERNQVFANVTIASLRNHAEGRAFRTIGLSVLTAATRPAFLLLLALGCLVLLIDNAGCPALDAEGVREVAWACLFANAFSVTILWLG